MLLRLIFEALVELLLKLLHHDRMSGVSLMLRVRLHFLKLVDSGLELGRGFFHVPLGLVTLLLEELEFAFPQGTLLVVVVVGVLQLAFHLSALLPRSVQLLLNNLTVSLDLLTQNTVLLSQFHNLSLHLLLQLCVLILKILLLHDQHVFFTLRVAKFFLKSLFQLFDLFSFGFEFSLSVFLVNRELLSFFTDFTLHFFPVHFDALFVPLNSALHLLAQIVGFLFGEHDLLLVQSRLAFEVDLLLSQFVFFVVEFGFDLGEALLVVSSVLGDFLLQ